ISPLDAPMPGHIRCECAVVHCRVASRSLTSAGTTTMFTPSLPLRSVIAHSARTWLCVFAAACGGDAPTEPEPPVLVVEATGRAERGLVLALGARATGAAGPLAGVVWGVEPAGAASVSADGHAQLLREG